jgi:hypothetical protein
MLTLRELHAAADAANRWPRKQARNWLRNSDADAKKAAAMLRDHPTYVKAGCPSVAVAKCRGEITADSLEDAFCDLSNLFANDAKPFMMLLADNPRLAGARLREFAGAERGLRDGA